MALCKESVIHEIEIRLGIGYIIGITAFASVDYAGCNLHCSALLQSLDRPFDGTDIYSRYLGQPFFRYMAYLCLVIRFAFNRCSNVNVGRFAVARLKLAN